MSSKNGMGRHGLNCYDSGYEQLVGVCKCGNEPSGSIKCGEFLDAENRLDSQEGLCYME